MANIYGLVVVLAFLTLTLLVAFGVYELRRMNDILTEILRTTSIGSREQTRELWRRPTGSEKKIAG